MFSISMTRYRTCNKHNTVTLLKLYSVLKGEITFLCHTMPSILILFPFIAGERKRTLHPSKPSRKRLSLYIVKYITEENTVLISGSNKLFKC